MGLPWGSAENILRWRSQYNRMERWYGRLREYGDDDSFQHDLDMYLTFFLNCYALRDWFSKSDVISENDMDALIQSNESMGLCRDICNRSKHLTLTRRPSVEANFSIVREFTPKGNRLIVIYLDKRRDLMEVATACARFWDDFLKTRLPPEPENPFAARRAG
jgi:hypothetical protein